MSVFERINPFLAYVVGIGLGAEMSRSLYTDGGSLAIAALSSVIATVLILSGEVAHRLEQKKTDGT
jgi:hypothetical protein